MDIHPRSRCRRGLLVVAVVLAGVAVSAGPSFGADDPAAGTAAGTRYDVTDYDVTMTYRPDSGTLRGATVVDARATDALDSFTLHINGLAVRSVVVDAAASFSRTGAEELVVVPAKPIRRGAGFRVRLAYDGTPGDGWLPTTSGGATAFMGRSSAWFPVHDDANDRAAFRLTATVPTGWSVVSVGREGPVRHAATTSTFRWAEPAVDPAHIAVTVDLLTVERSTLADGTPVVNAYAPGLRDSTAPLADRLPEILDFLSGRFGRYPFRAAGNVFVHVDDDAPATAPQTRPVYLGAGNEQFMNLNAVVHEQAHQWYGISAAARDNADSCLAECFAVYATWLWDETKDGVDLDTRYREQVAATKDDPGAWLELYRPGQTPGINLYSKGPLALHALRRQVGETAFARMLEQWPTSHRGDHLTWPQFERFAEKLTRQDLTGFFHAWFRAATVPPDEYLWPGALAP